MTKTKQQKFTDSLRQTQTNTFSEGLNMDLHPMSTPNTVLTDCINGTTITYNDNEFVLQNERGNTQILDAQLSAGFIPVAMKEYNGILYIISYNPTEQKTEIGTFPSPRQGKDVESKQFDSEIISDYISYYSNYNKDVTYYDYSLSVSNYDKYYLSVGGQNYNPLLVLEHYVLDKQGNSSKVKLVQTGESYRFTHVGEGVLGYVYRPYFLTSVTSSLIETKGASSAKLVIETITDDDTLWEPDFDTSNVKNKKKIDDFKITHSVKITMLSEKNDELEIDLENSDIRHGSKLEVDAVDWDYTYNLSNTSIIDLQFAPEFRITEEDTTKTYKYDFRNECVVLMDGDNPTDICYNNIKFDISTSITKDDYVLHMDNLNHSVIVNAANVFAQESWFSKFQYFESTDQTSANPDEVLIDFNIQLDLESYDINYQLYTDSNKGEATFKLHEIDETGNLKGVTVSGASVSSASRIFDVVTDVSLMKAGDLWIDMNGTEGVLYYNKPNVGVTQMQDPDTINQCSEFKSKSVAHVQYVKKDATTYDMILLDSGYNIVTTTNLFNTLRGEICGNDMEEYFTSGYFDFVAKNVKVKKNSFYLFELTFNILNVTENAWKTERASFIVITSDSMLNKERVSGENRMDEILLESWFGVPYNIGENGMDNLVDATPGVVTKNNTLNLKEIKDKTYEELVTYTHKFFLKYDPLFSQANNYVIPQIYKNLDVTFNFKNTSAFNCFVELDDRELFSSTAHDDGQDLKKTYKKTWTLSGKASEIRQTVKRKYLWDLFKEINKVDKIKFSGYESTSIDYNHIPDVMGYVLDNPKASCATVINQMWDKTGTKYTNMLLDWLNSDNEIDSAWVLSKYLWNYLVPNTHTLYGASLRLMKPMFTDNGLHYGELTWPTGNNNLPKYTGNKKKIWMHGKHGGIYVLLGLDLQEDYETTNNYYKELLKHTYYLVPTNKKLYQYSYDTETVYENNVNIGDQIVIKSIDPEINNNLTGKIYPKQCLFIDLDYSSFNIQSFNNINYHVLDNINVTDHNSKIITSFGELDENYSTFLRLLGELLNKYPISENTLNEYFDKNLRFDYYAEHLQENDCFLFTDNDELLNKGQFNNTFNTISTPNLQYDQDLQILYNPYVFENNINTYGSGRGVLKWNYSMKFDDFWPINDDELKNLNDYHSLLFYRYSSYANE